MITIQRIQTSNLRYYSFIEKLYISAFPKEERRELALQKHYTDNNTIFYNNIILYKNQPVGFITYWDFNDFYYIEHFAIAPEQRNGGFGQKVLAYIHEKLHRPIVLEVELPTEEISKRRIEFYKRQGYQLWENEYMQPPYNQGDSYLPMRLMVKGEFDQKTDYKWIKQQLYTKVYLTKEI